MHIPKSRRTDDDEKHSHQVIFIGYSTERKAYRVKDPKLEKTWASSDVEFDESTGGLRERVVIELGPRRSGRNLTKPIPVGVREKLNFCFLRVRNEYVLNTI
jgi:hypothetical protein